jgi:serine/threonine protein kinase
LIGRTLAHYRITAAIGAGGMGEVYRATDTKLGRDVALKVLPADMAASPERLDRFRREAKALASVPAGPSRTSPRSGEISRWAMSSRGACGHRGAGCG